MLPETRNIPLEEIAKIFGDEDQIAVYSESLYVDSNTHQLVLDMRTGAGEGMTQTVTKDGTNAGTEYKHREHAAMEMEMS